MKYDYRTDTYSGDPLPESEATLMVYFDQTVGGIPVICGAAESFTRYAGMNNREAYRYHGAIAITQGLKSIGLNEIYKSLQFHLLSPAALLAEDVPLCSFEEVKETYLDLIRAGLAEEHCQPAAGICRMAQRNGLCLYAPAHMGGRGRIVSRCGDSGRIRPKAV